MLSIAANHARRHIRSAVRRRAAERKLRVLQALPRAPKDAPDDTVDRERLARLLTDALDRLPVEQRVAFVLCEVEELSSLEAAQITGASENTMRARLFHAKRRLREALVDGGAR